MKNRLLKEALTLTARKVVMPRATLAGATVSLIQNPIQDIATHIAYHGDPDAYTYVRGGGFSNGLRPVAYSGHHACG